MFCYQDVNAEDLKTFYCEWTGALDWEVVGSNPSAQKVLDNLLVNHKYVMQCGLKQPKKIKKGLICVVF